MPLKKKKPVPKKKTGGKKMTTVKKKKAAPKGGPAHRKMDWKQLSDSIPYNKRRKFVEMLLMAEFQKKLHPVGEKYPDNPVVLIIKDFIRTGASRYLNIAYKAIAGTNKNASLLIWKM